MNFVATVIALVLGVRASDIKPVDANAFVAELNGLLVKYQLPSTNLLLAPVSGSTTTATGPAPLKTQGYSRQHHYYDSSGSL